MPNVVQLMGLSSLELTFTDSMLLNLLGPIRPKTPTLLYLPLRMCQCVDIQCNDSLRIFSSARNTLTPLSATTLQHHRSVADYQVFISSASAVTHLSRSLYEAGMMYTYV